MEVLLIDVYNFESNQGVVNESKIADWKAVLAEARKIIRMKSNPSGS